MSYWSGFKSRLWETGTTETHSCPLLVIMCTVIQVQSVLESGFAASPWWSLHLREKESFVQHLLIKSACLIWKWTNVLWMLCACRACQEGFQRQTNALLGCQDTFLLISTCRFSLWHSTHTEDKCTRVFKHANRPSGAWRCFRLYFNLLRSSIRQTTQLKTVTSGTSFHREATKQYLVRMFPLINAYMMHEVLLKVPKS